MPEGDTLYATARRLGAALTGCEVRLVSGTHPVARREGRRLSGRIVEDVEAVGKHLLIHFSGDWSLRTHLGMSGSWQLYRPGEPWRRTPGKARVVLEAAEWVAVCFAAPTVEIAPRRHVAASLSHLGPDLSGPDFDEADFLRRAAERATGRSVADLLLDQRVMAGVGNVYKSEVLFLERTHPATPAQDLEQAALLGLARRARKLLVANQAGGRRNTTGMRGRDGDAWVYGRQRRPCRRCGTTISDALIGDPARITYWCPSCQPSPVDSRRDATSPKISGAPARHDRRR